MKSNTRVRRTEYAISGSAALAPVRSRNIELSNHARKNREKAAHMSPGYLIFIVLSLTMVVLFCGMFLYLQSEVTGLNRSVSRMESQLSDLSLSNDEEYARIMGAVDLEEIKRIAMEELGMTYPDESQVVNFVDFDSDYVRQYGSIPE